MASALLHCAYGLSGCAAGGSITTPPPAAPGNFVALSAPVIMENHAGDPVIHLGDMMDVSCSSEGERLGRIMAAAKQEGAILPGNHDGLMFGIFNYNVAAIGRDRDSGRWDRACRRAAYQDGDPDAPPQGIGAASSARRSSRRSRR